MAAEHDYISGLVPFFLQAPHVIVANFHTGKLPVYSGQIEKIRKSLQEKGIDTDLAHLSTYNLSSAKAALSNYQGQFRMVFGHLTDQEELAVLEEKEKDLLSTVWSLWYFFAHDPRQEWASPRAQIPAKIGLTKRGIEKQLHETAGTINQVGVKVTALDAMNDWDGAPALWLRLELEDATRLYITLEQLVLTLRGKLGPIDWQGLEQYIIDENWPYTVIVPVVHGRMINCNAWRLHTFAVVLSDKKLEEMPWSFVPQAIPSRNWEQLGLAVWDTQDLVLANRLSETVGALSFFVAQLADLCNIPEVTEPGQKVLQMYVEKQSATVSQYLQAAFDAIEAMVRRIGELLDAEPKLRDKLEDTFAGLTELHKLVVPSDEFDGQQAFGLDKVAEYAKRLEHARPLAEAVQLLWINAMLECMPQVNMTDGAA